MTKNLPYLLDLEQEAIDLYLDLSKEQINIIKEAWGDFDTELTVEKME